MSASRPCLVTLVAVALASLVACGPSDPSSEGITLRGALEGGGGPAGFGADEPIVITVQQARGITATIASDGSFMLRGLPEGAFTLAFTRGNQPLGTLQFDEVKADQQITIRIALSADGNSIMLLEETRDGLGHGDVTAEDRIEAVLALDPQGDSIFLFDGHTILARVGVTTIRQGSQSRTVNDLVVGLIVQVTGKWLVSNTGGQVVLAQEITILGDDQGDDDEGDDDEACMISGGKVGKKIQLEGAVTSGNAASFELQVNGNRAPDLVDVDAGAASFKCVGGKKTPPAQCPAQVVTGANVHVSGLLEACDGTDALVVANKVKVQK